jgi:hypothetical protein
MPVERIDALCCCEGCSKRFGVELELSEDLKDGAHADFESLVRETVLNGNAITYTWGVRGKATVDRLPLSYQATIQGDLLLCDECSKRCDDLPIENDLTREQVEKALNLPWGPNS